MRCIFFVISQNIGLTAFATALLPGMRKRSVNNHGGQFLLHDVGASALLRFAFLRRNSMNLAWIWIHIILVLAFVTIVIVQDDAGYERINHKKS